MFGLFILFLLVGTTNAVNITDGLDGLAGGLSAIAFFAYGVITAEMVSAVIKVRSFIITEFGKGLFSAAVVASTY